MRLAAKLLFVGFAVLATGCVKPSKRAHSSDAEMSADAHILSPNAPAIQNFDQPIEVKGSSCGLKQIDDGEEEEDLKSVLDQCGIDDLNDKNKKTFATKIDYGYNRLIHAGFGKAKVPLVSTLDLSGTLAQTTLMVHVKVGEVSGNSRGEALLDSDIQDIQRRAEELADIFRGPATAVSVEQNSNFGKAWKGILCTITAAKSMVNKRNKSYVEATYDPPFAPNISPIAELQRYVKEIGNHRYFQDIQAKVVKAENSILQTGQVLIGNVVVEKIPNNTQVEIQRFNPETEEFEWIKRDIKSDIAFRISNRFGSEAQTLALGFHLWTEYYVDTKNRNFSAVIANVGDEETMHFFRDDEITVED